MSSSTPSKAPAKPTFSPISLNDTDLAKLYTHIHPIVVLSIYFVSFKLIVADPVSALASLLLPLAALQSIYVVICLPPTGAGHAGSVGSSTAKGKKTAGKGKKGEVTLGMRVIPALISLLLTLSLGTPILLTMIILLGGPLTTHIPHTLLLAAHLSLLTALPLIYTRGISASTWRAVAALEIPVDEVFGAALGACLGTWFGAVPIPLDWDREWQKWPVTVLTGAYLGWGLGKVMGGTLLRGKVVDMGP